MAEDKTVLVCFGPRHREVKFRSGPGIGCNVDALERNIRSSLADVESLKASTKLILQVCSFCIYKMNFNMFFYMYPHGSQNRDYCHPNMVHCMRVFKCEVRL